MLTHIYIYPHYFIFLCQTLILIFVTCIHDNRDDYFLEHEQIFQYSKTLKEQMEDSSNENNIMYGKWKIQQ